MSSSTQAPRKASLAVRLTAYAFFALLLVAVAVLAMELYLRRNPAYGRAGFRFDTELIYRLNPGLKAQKPYAAGHSDQPPFLLTFNRQGFRGDDFRADKPEGVVRILALGDSYTAGLDYPDSVTFLGQWERKLNAQAPKGVRYEVLNASCPAWGTDQQYIYWKQEGQALNPDAVVIFYSPNDMREMWNHALVRVNEGSGVIDIKKAQLPTRERLGWGLACRSSLFQYAQQKWMKTNYGDFLKVFLFYPVHYGKEDSTDWDRPLFMRGEPFPEMGQSYVLLERLLLDMEADCKQRNIPLHVVKLPIELEIDATYADTTQYDRARVEQQLGVIAQRNGFNYHNFNERLREHPQPADIFMDWEYHYDQDGHNWVGEALFNAVKLK